MQDFEQAEFRDEVKPLILRENAMRLFGLARLHQPVLLLSGRVRQMTVATRPAAGSLGFSPIAGQGGTAGRIAVNQ